MITTLVNHWSHVSDVGTGAGARGITGIIGLISVPRPAQVQIDFLAGVLRREWRILNQARIRRLLLLLPCGHARAHCSPRPSHHHRFPARPSRRITLMVDESVLTKQRHRAAMTQSDH